MIRASKEALGKTSGRGPTGDKETWWWNEKAQEAIRKKKWETSRRKEDREEYKRANKKAKKAVARAKAIEYNDVYEELDTPERERERYLR